MVRSTLHPSPALGLGVEGGSPCFLCSGHQGSEE